MRISELIIKLQEFQDEYGDMNVDFGDHTQKSLYPFINHFPIKALSVVYIAEKLKDRLLMIPKVVVH